MTIEEYFDDWKKVINLSEAESTLKKAIASKGILCPQPKDVFKAFHLCSLHDLRVVILGQDPYPNLRSVCCNNIVTKVPVATGIAFANSPDTSENNYSPSLETLKESVINFTVPHRSITFDASLEKWEEQGVLLLNTALTCIAGQTGTHSLLWRPFIRNFLTSLSKYTTGIVYVLMGKDAQSFEYCINNKFNRIIKCKHPSWYARNGTRMPSDVWKQINSVLIDMNGYGIEWYKEY